MIAGSDDGIVHEPRIELERLRRRVGDLERVLKLISTWAGFPHNETGAGTRPDIRDAAQRALYPERYR